MSELWMRGAEKPSGELAKTSQRDARLIDSLDNPEGGGVSNCAGGEGGLIGGTLPKRASKGIRPEEPRWIRLEQQTQGLKSTSEKTGWYRI